MNNIRGLLIITLVTFLGFFSSCDENGDFLIFGIQNDIELGQQVAGQIEADPDTYPILDRAAYPEAYAYIEGMMNDILSSEDVTYKDDFPWKINIIDDEVLNAFATPGGQIYVYTGLIYFLDKEDDLAGVIGHEIAHADQRHSSKQLQRQYGISILLSVIAGRDAGNLAQLAGQIAGTLGGLRFSREAESEADEFSIKYLDETTYACNGAAAFFEKLLANEVAREPEFLSTHPSPENRVDDINALASSLGCSTTVDDQSTTRYQDFQALLP